MGNVSDVSFTCRFNCVAFIDQDNNGIALGDNALNIDEHWLSPAKECSEKFAHTGMAVPLSCKGDEVARTVVSPPDVLVQHCHNAFNVAGFEVCINILLNEL